MQPQKPDLILTEDQREILTRVRVSRSDQQRRVERARILVAFADGESISSICRRLGTYRRKVERIVDKALELVPLAALDDLQRRGRPTKITPEARAWLLSWACQKPKALGYSYELWTTELLARYPRALPGAGASGPRAARSHRIRLFLKEVNQTPVQYKWKYGLDELT